jgi:hypothetical protein
MLLDGANQPYGFEDRSGRSGPDADQGQLSDTRSQVEAWLTFA